MIARTSGRGGPPSAPAPLTPGVGMSYYGYGFNPALIGCRLQGVTVKDDGTILVVSLADGRRNTYEAEGDCCSSSWVEHVTAPPDIDGATVTGVTEGGYIDGRDATPEEYDATRAKREYVDVLRVYQSSIQTDRGEIIVEYRNDSNGYYGGSLRERQGLA